MSRPSYVGELPVSTSVSRREQLAASLRVQQKRAARRTLASLILAQARYTPSVTVFSRTDVHYLIDKDSRTIASLADSKIAEAVADFLNS